MGDFKISDAISKQTGNNEIAGNELAQIIQRGSTISVKHQSIFEHVLTVIQKTDGNKVFFMLPEMFLKNNVMKGDHVECHIMQGYNEYVLFGIISGFNLNYPQMVEITAERIKKYRNNRKTKRYLVNFPASIYCNEWQEEFYAIIKNISMTGVSAVFKEEIDTQESVNLVVNVNVENERNIKFKAKIIRIIEREFYNEYGLEIIDIDMENKDLIERLTFRLEQDETEFVSEALKKF